MANWRRKVLTLFPELRIEAQQPGFTVYSTFFHLLPTVRQAHKDDNEELLRRIYGFAEWSLEQRAKDMWNAAGVAFYEHLFDSHPTLWPDMVQWLSPRVVADCSGLWEFRLTTEAFVEVNRLLAGRRRHRYREARLALPHGD